MGKYRTKELNDSVIFAASAEQRGIDMEMTLKRTNISRRWLIIIVAVLCLFPTIKVVAQAFGGFDTEKLIGMDGVANSQLLIRSSGTSNSLFDIIMGASEGEAVLSPFTGAGSFVNLYPLMLVVLGVVLLVGLFQSKEQPAFKIVIAAVLIYVLINMLPGLQTIITQLFGGIPGA